MQMISKATNLASPLSPEFSSDELSLIIGTCLPEAVAVLEVRTGQLVGGNRKLESLLGVRLDEGPGREELLDGFVHPDDQNLFRICRTADFTAQDGAIEVRFRAQGGFLNAETYFASFRWQRVDYLLVYIRPTVDKSSVEVALKERIVEQRRKTLEAIKSSLLIYQFTEKIKKTPVLTTKLLSTENESQLFERAAGILTCDGLNYKDVTFLLLRGEYMEVSFSTKPLPRQTYSVHGDNKYAQLVKDDFEGVKSMDGEILVPLRSRGTFLGVVEVTRHPRERIFFDELNLMSVWQKDALLTIGDMIALLLDNLRLYREVKRQSIIDSLTGVYNRNYFTDRLSTEIHRCIRNGDPISMIFIDVDRFKEINDSHGHIVGDQILRGLGLILKTNLRDYDFICRYGGDEFVILLPQVDQEKARKIGQDLLNVVRNHNFQLVENPRAELRLSISMGISCIHEEMDDDLFLRSADEALYEAKARGRDQVVLTDRGAGDPAPVAKPAVAGASSGARSGSGTAGRKPAATKRRHRPQEAPRPGTRG